jgi:hypothetical protein
MAPVDSNSVTAAVATSSTINVNKGALDVFPISLGIKFIMINLTLNVNNLTKVSWGASSLDRDNN